LTPTYLVNVEKCIADGKVRKNHHIDLPQYSSRLGWIYLFMKLVWIVEQSHGCVAIYLLRRLPSWFKLSIFAVYNGRCLSRMHFGAMLWLSSSVTHIAFSLLRPCKSAVVSMSS
jgi:hypothetical protein